MKFECWLIQKRSRSVHVRVRIVGICGLFLFAMTYPFDWFFGFHRLERAKRIREGEGI